MASPEVRAMQKCHVILVNTIKLSVDSIAGDLYGEELITEDVHAAMSLQNDVAQVKAGKLIDCVRTKVSIKPARVHEFTAVLRRNSGEEAANALEDKILELGGTIPSRTQSAGASGSSGASPGSTQRTAVLNEEITQSKLNLIEWKKNDKERDVRLKVEMSVKWKEMGQNVGISDAVLQGYRGDNTECMDKVITKWKTKGHKKYPATWAGLIKLLKSVELNNLVAMIEEAADDKESTLYEK